MSETMEGQFDDTQELPKIPKQSSHSESLIKKKSTDTVSRRSVLKAGLGFALSALVGKKVIERDNSPQNTIASDSVEQVDQFQDPIFRLNKIAAQEVHQRRELESQYLDLANSIESIDLGLMVCADQQVRRALLQKRWELRRSSTEMIQLTDQQMEFCDAEGITYEVLGMCLDAEAHAMEVIARLQPILREDEYGKQVHPQMLMINAGGMAKLIMTETNGFVNIGGEKAYTQLVTKDEITQEDIPDEDQIGALQRVCAFVNKQTGLSLNYLNVPGSGRGNKEQNASGGAIGIQFMPMRAEEYITKIVEQGGFDAKQDGNVFDAIQSIVMAWTFLACHEQVLEGEPTPDKFRYGYMRNETQPDGAIELSLLKWNAKRDQMEAIRDAAYQYSDAGL